MNPPESFLVVFVTLLANHLERLAVLPEPTLV